MSHYWKRVLRLREVWENFLRPCCFWGNGKTVTICDKKLKKRIA